MLKYKIESNGKATNLCECAEDYVADEGWFTIEGGIIPDIDTLHTQEYKDAQALVQYKEDRRAEYPSVGDQLDMLMKDMKNGTKTHQEACEAVKTKYPKG